MVHVEAKKPKEGRHDMEQVTHTHKPLLRLTEVKGRTGKSASSIYEAIAAGQFPRPIKVGPRTSAWVEAEVDAWIEDRIRERDGESVRGAA
jgi:prophage regulatory protein